MFPLGKGTNFWKKNGALYDGDWRNNKRCGFGTLSVPGEGGDYKRVYAGGWKADKRHVREFFSCFSKQLFGRCFGTVTLF